MNHLAKTLGQFLSKSTPGPEVPALGDRELEVMKILWQDEPLSAKQVLQSIPDQGLSLSTMQTTLERLHRKNLLDREKAGRYYVYKTSVTRSQIISSLLGDITEQICDGDVATLVSGFTNFYSDKTSDPGKSDAGVPASSDSESTDDQSAN